MSELQKFLKSDTGKYIVIGAVLIVFGPALLRKLLSGIAGQIESVVSDTGTIIRTGAGNVINETFPPEYVQSNGIGYEDLKKEFGESCTNAILSGGAMSTLVYCPFGWQDRLKEMNNAKSAMNGLNTINLKRSKSGVYYAPRMRT